MYLQVTNKLHLLAIPHPMMLYYNISIESLNKLGHQKTLFNIKQVK